MPRGGGTAHVLLQHLAGDSIAEINVSTHDAANGNQHLFGGFLLHDVTVRAGSQSAFGIDRFVVHRENQNRHVRVAGTDCFHEFKAVRSVERDIYDEDVRLQRGNRSQRRLRFFGGAAYDHVWLAIDEQAESLTDDWMIVDDKDLALAIRRADGGFRIHASRLAACFSPSGKVHATFAPPDSPGPTWSVPPIMFAR